MWVECNSIFNDESEEKLLINLCFIDSIEQLTLKIDNAISVFKTNLNF